MRASGSMALVAFVGIGVGLAGCVATPISSTASPSSAKGACDFESTASDGSVVPAREALWTRTTDLERVVDASHRLAAIPPATLRLGDASPPSVPDRFTHDGVDYMDRHASCRRPGHGSTAGAPFAVEAQGPEARNTRLHLLYHHPGGLALGTSETWSEPGPRVEGRLNVSHLGLYLAQVSVEYRDGTARTDGFELSVRAAGDA